MAILSKSCEYGLRAAVHVAADTSGGYVSIGKISGDLGISFHFLTKILQQLTEKGIMRSYRGPRGGVKLARPARDISLYDVVEAIGGERMFKGCLLGLRDCDDKHPCPLHSRWTVERKRLKKLFAETRLDRVARQLRRNGSVLWDQPL